MNTRVLSTVTGLLAAVMLAGCDNATPNKPATTGAAPKAGGQVAGPKATTGTLAPGAKPSAEAPKPTPGPTTKPGEQPAVKPTPASPAGTGAAAPPSNPPAVTPPKPAETPKPPAPKPEAPKPETPKPPPVLETIDKNGVLVEVLNYGNGAEAKPGGWVKMHYRGTLSDGTEFDSSYSRNEPLEKELTGLIKGWQLGIPGMRVGGKRRLTVPPDLGYGPKEIRNAQGQVIIPANSMLVFEVELLDAR